MTERRRWKADEKLALINEIREKGQIVETCRKYGVEGLRSRTRNSGPSIRKLTGENERLKKMLAEKELEVSTLQESYKRVGDIDPDESVQIQGFPGDKNARYSQHSWKLLL